MATAINRESVLVSTRRRIVTFCKRQKGQKLWRRFHITSTMDQSDAERLNGELIFLFPDKDFQLEIEKPRL